MQPKVFVQKLGRKKELPETWTAAIVLIREMLATHRRTVVDNVSYSEARDMFEQQLLKIPHPGTGDRTQLAHKRRERSDIAPVSAGGWIWAMAQQVFGQIGKNLTIDDFTQKAVSIEGRQICVCPNAKTLLRLLDKHPRKADAVRHLETQMLAFEACCDKVKSIDAQAGAKHRRLSAKIPAPAHVLAWVKKYRRLHNKDDVGFIRERWDGVMTAVHRWLDRGDTKALAEVEPVLSHYLHVFEDNDVRVKLTQAATVERENGKRIGALLVEKVHALVEGFGWELLRRKRWDELNQKVLTEEVWDKVIPEAEKAAEKANDSEAVRLVKITRGVWWRLKALVNDQAGAMPIEVLRALGQSAKYFLSAHHESLVLSVVADVAMIEARIGLKVEALERIDKALKVAVAQGNGRRRFRLHCLGAEIAHELGQPGVALGHLYQAEDVFRALQDADPKVLTKNVPKPWYQPSYQKELDRVRHVLADVTGPVTLQGLLDGASFAE